MIPVIQEIRKTYPDCLISIDSYKPEVARKAIMAGANIINDISGLSFDSAMIELIYNTKVPVIIMHMSGTPKNMQLNPIYDDLISDMISFFRNQITKAWSGGAANITKSRTVSAPYLSINSSGSIVLPLDLDIFAPSFNTIPCVKRFIKGSSVLHKP